MANIGDTPSSNDGNVNSNESSDEYDQNSTMDHTAVSSEVSTPPLQLVTHTNGNLSHQQINQLIEQECEHGVPLRRPMIPAQYCGIDIRLYWYWLMFILMGLCIGHSLLWIVLVSIGLGIRVADAISSSAWTYDKRLRVKLGNSQSWSMIHTVAFNPNGQRVDPITQPSDTPQLLLFNAAFSTTITEYFPLVRESIAVENSQPHTMRVTVSRQRFVINDQNGHADSNATRQIEPKEITTPQIHDGVNIQVGAVDNATTGAPTEIPRDTDFSIATTDQPLNSRLNNDDEQRRNPETTPSIALENHSTNISIDGGQTAIHTENISGSNQTNLIDTQAIAAELINSLSPQTSSTERSIDAPAEGGPQAILPNTSPTISHVPKMPALVNSSEESSEETGA